MKKLRSQSGMTLTELLCSIVILLLVSQLMAAGVRFSVKTYRDSMAASQAQVLCSTLTTVVSDKLRYCGTVSEDGGQIFIQDMGNVTEGEDGKVFSINADGELMLGENKILGSRSYPEGLRVKSFNMEYDAASGIFKVSFQVGDSGDTPLAGADFEVKRINSRT